MCETTLTGHTNVVENLCMLSDGTLLSGSRDSTFRAWKDGVCIATMSDHTESVYALCQLSNGTVVSGSDDETIRLWRPASTGGAGAGAGAGSA